MNLAARQATDLAFAIDAQLAQLRKDLARLRQGMPPGETWRILAHLDNAQSILCDAASPLRESIKELSYLLEIERQDSQPTPSEVAS